MRKFPQNALDAKMRDEKSEQATLKPSASATNFSVPIPQAPEATTVQAPGTARENRLESGQARMPSPPATLRPNDMEDEN